MEPKCTEIGAFRYCNITKIFLTLQRNPSSVPVFGQTSGFSLIIQPLIQLLLYAVETLCETARASIGWRCGHRHSIRGAGFPMEKNDYNEAYK